MSIPATSLGDSSVTLPGIEVGPWMLLKYLLFFYYGNDKQLHYKKFVAPWTLCEHGLAAWTWIGSLNMDRQREHGLGAWTWIGSANMECALGLMQWLCPILFTVCKRERKDINTAGALSFLISYKVISTTYTNWRLDCLDTLTPSGQQGNEILIRLLRYSCIIV